MKVRKIVVMGGRAVGKSSLIVQFVENHFAETYYPYSTLFLFQKKNK